MLNKAALKQGIKSILTDMESRTEDSKDEFASRLADLIDTYVKGLTITYTVGLTSPSGAVAGTFNYTLS